MRGSGATERRQKRASLTGFTLFFCFRVRRKSRLFGGLSVSVLWQLFNYAPIEQEQFLPLLFRREPLPFPVLAFEYAHRDIVRPPQIRFHLRFQIIKGMKPQKLIKAFVIRPVGTFDFPVISRSSRLYRFMLYSLFLAEFIKGMLPPAFHFLRERKFRAIIRLYNLRLIAKIQNCPPYAIDGIIRYLFTIRIYEPLARGFVYHGVLIEILIFEYRTCRALFRNVFHVELPFYTNMFGRVIWFWLIRYVLPLMLIKAGAPQITIECYRVALICVIQPQFSVKLIQPDIRVAAD